MSKRARKYFDRGLYLPSGLAITEEQVQRVADTILKIHNKVH